MKYISNILSAIGNLAKNKWVWVRSLVFVAAIFAGAILFSRTKTDTKGVKACEKERSDLIQALIDIRTELSPVETTSITTNSALPLASLSGDISNNNIDNPNFVVQWTWDSLTDTIKPKSQEQKVQKVLTKIDSLLLKYKIPQQKQKSSI